MINKHITKYSWQQLINVNPRGALSLSNLKQKQNMEDGNKEKFNVIP